MSKSIEEYISIIDGLNLKIKELEIILANQKYEISTVDKLHMQLLEKETTISELKNKLIDLQRTYGTDFPKIEKRTSSFSDKLLQRRNSSSSVVPIKTSLDPYRDYKTPNA